jgi:hypothetical protein
MDDPNSRSDSPFGHRQVVRLRKVMDVQGEVAPGAGLSASDLFTILWLALADILGTAAAATLLRRAAQRAVRDWPELAQLSITREELDYRYVVPSAWNEPTVVAPEGLLELTRELWPLIVELTGSVVVKRIARIPELRERGLVPAHVSPP